MRMFRINALLVLVVFVSDTFGHPSYRNFIPNGRNVKHPCNGSPWGAVGHMASTHTSIKNAFGLAFKAGRGELHLKWNEICMEDSDGDGLTNGEELGDPNCEWSMGSGVRLGPVLGHPGFCEPDRATCKDGNSYNECKNPNDRGRGNSGNTGSQGGHSHGADGHRSPPPEANDHPQTFFTKHMRGPGMMNGNRQSNRMSGVGSAMSGTGRMNGVNTRNSRMGQMNTMGRTNRMGSSMSGWGNGMDSGNIAPTQTQSGGWSSMNGGSRGTNDGVLFMGQQQSMSSPEVSNTGSMTRGGQGFNGGSMTRGDQWTTGGSSTSGRQWTNGQSMTRGGQGMSVANTQPEMGVLNRNLNQFIQGQPRSQTRGGQFSTPSGGMQFSNTQSQSWQQPLNQDMVQRSVQGRIQQLRRTAGGASTTSGGFQDFDTMGARFNSGGTGSASSPMFTSEGTGMTGFEGFTTMGSGNGQMQGFGSSGTGSRRVEGFSTDRSAMGGSQRFSVDMNAWYPQEFPTGRQTSFRRRLFPMF